MQQLRGLCEAARDSNFVVSVPQRLLIQSPRLGLFLRFTQVCLTCTIGIYFIFGQRWLKHTQPTALKSVFRHEGAAARAFPAAHCRNASLYWYNYSDTLAYRPTGCKAFSKAGPSWTADEAFVSTLVQDMTIWRGKGSQCSPGAQESCSGAWSESSGGSKECACTIRRELFTDNPEEDQLFVFHGYEVDTSDGKGEWIIRGWAHMSKKLEGPKDAMKEAPGMLLTVIQRPDGSPCMVGGRSEWSSDQSQYGISGTLFEWLNCAGVTLDSNPNDIVNTGGLPKHIRTMGIGLQLTLDYKNSHSLGHDGVVCYLTVESRVQWTSTAVVQEWVRIPSSTGEQIEAERSQVEYGVAIWTKTTGSYVSFDRIFIISEIVELWVLFQFPLQLTRFIALYCLGIYSEIYRRARQTKFDPYSYFLSSIGRMLVSEVSFRAVMGIWEGRACEIEGMNLNCLMEHLQDIFHEQLTSGMLRHDEINQIAHLAFKYMDVDETGTISCSEFLRSCSEHDIFDVHFMARFLAHGRNINRLSPLASIFQSGKLHEQMQASRTSRWSTALVRLPSEFRMKFGLVDSTCRSVDSGTSQATASVVVSAVSGAAVRDDGDSCSPSVKLIGKAEEPESPTKHKLKAVDDLDSRSNYFAKDGSMMQRIRTLEELQAESLSALESVQDRWLVVSAETAGWSRRLEVLEEKVSNHQRQCPGLVAVVNVGIGTSDSSNSIDPSKLAPTGTGCRLCRCGSSCDMAASGTGSSICEAAKRRREVDDVQMKEILAKIHQFDKAIALLSEHLESRCLEWKVVAEQDMSREKNSKKAKFQQEPKASGPGVASACHSWDGALAGEALEDKHRSNPKLEKADTGGTNVAANAAKNACMKSVGNAADRLQSEKGAVTEPAVTCNKPGEELQRRKPSREEVARSDAAPAGRTSSPSTPDRPRSAAITRTDARIMSPSTSLAVSSSSGVHVGTLSAVSHSAATSASPACSPLSSVFDAPLSGTRESSLDQVSSRLANTHPTEQPAAPAESCESVAPAGFVLTEKLQAVAEDVFGDALVPEEEGQPNVLISSESVKDHFASADRNATCNSSSSQQATSTWPGSGAAGRPLQQARGSSLGRGSAALVAAARERQRQDQMQQQQQRRPTIEPQREPLLHGRQQGEQRQQDPRLESEVSALRKAISPLPRGTPSALSRRSAQPRSHSSSSAAEAQTWKASATALTAVSDGAPAKSPAAAAAISSRSAGATGLSAASASRRPPTLATSRCSPTAARKNSEPMSPRLNLDVGENGNNWSF